MLLDEAGDQLLVGIDAAERSSNAKDDDPIGVLGGGEQLIGGRVEGILLLNIAAGEIHVRRKFHFGLLCLPGELDELVRKMVRIPHQVGVRVE